MLEFQTYIPQLLLVYLTYIVATVSPGPTNLAVMSVSLNKGRKAGVVFALGVVTGSLTWAVLAITGLTEFVRSHDQLFFYIKILGGLYLLWIALKALRLVFSSNKASAHCSLKQSSLMKIYLQGLAIHLTNPKTFFVWLAIISLGIQESSPMWITLSIFIGCAILGCSIFIAYALIFSHQLTIKKYQKVRRPLEAMMATVFGYAGITLITEDIV